MHNLTASKNALQHWTAIRTAPRLTKQDIQFIKCHLEGELCFEEELHSETLESNPARLRAALENPALVHAVLEIAEALPISPELYFYVVIHKALEGLQLNTNGVAEYMVTLLEHIDELDPAEPLYLSAALRSLDNLSPEEQFYAHIYLGNQTLLITGFFRHFLIERTRRYGAPDWHFFQEIGINQYIQASEHPLAEDWSAKPLFETLSQKYLPIRTALNQLRSDFLFLGGI